MASILYLPAENSQEERFRSLLEIAVPEKKLEIYRTFEELSRGLRETGSGVKVAILFAVNQVEITQILSLGDVLADVKIILILADEDKETMMKAHRLRPRYVTWMDYDLVDIVTVFKRMVALYDII